MTLSVRNMPTVTVTGWHPGCLTISALTALQNYTDLGLADRKALIEKVIDGGSVDITVPSDLEADELASQLRAFKFVAAAR